jgi:hypothetical protein
MRQLLERLVMPGTKAEAKPKATVIIDAGFAKICRNWGQAGAK